MKNLKAPEHLRKGQALFTFLSWLATQDKVAKTLVCYQGKTKDKKTDEHFHLGDTFNIPDDQLEKLWDEWVASLPRGRP